MRASRAAFAATLSLVFWFAAAINPPITVRYTADPSAHVWPGDEGRLWIYSSHDREDASTYDTMDRYYVYSTLDMVNYQSHGLALHLDNVTWAAERVRGGATTYGGGRGFKGTNCSEQPCKARMRWQMLCERWGGGATRAGVPAVHLVVGGSDPG